MNTHLLNQTESQPTGTKEWAGSNVNIARGCPNGCIYCYAKSMIKRYNNKITAEDLQIEVINTQKVNKGYRKRKDRIMMPSSHDITPTNLSAFLTVAEKLLNAGNKVLIVSKPRFDCIKELCDKLYLYKHQILFRFTIGSTNNELLNFWETRAPLFEERLASLEYAYLSGYKTSISIEPFLDDNVEDIVNQTRPYVTTSIWIGEANDLKIHLSNNNHKDPDTMAAADKLLNLYSSGYVEKLYEHYKNDDLIIWKDSIRKRLNLPPLSEEQMMR